MPELFPQWTRAHSTRVIADLDQRRAFSGHQVFGCHPDRPHLVGRRLSILMKCWTAVKNKKADT